MCDFLCYPVNQGHCRSFAFSRFCFLAILYNHFGEEHQALMDIFLRV